MVYGTLKEHGFKENNTLLNAISYVCIANF